MDELYREHDRRGQSLTHRPQGRRPFNIYRATSVGALMKEVLTNSGKGLPDLALPAKFRPEDGNSGLSARRIARVAYWRRLSWNPRADLREYMWFIPRHLFSIHERGIFRWARSTSCNLSRGLINGTNLRCAGDFTVDDRRSECPLFYGELRDDDSLINARDE